MCHFEVAAQGCVHQYGAWWEVFTVERSPCLPVGCARPDRSVRAPGRLMTSPAHCRMALCRT
eukprot:2546890-Prymnesium_polylepis.1